MDLENMTDEDYFGHMKIMFHTEGWQILMEELKVNAQVIGDIQDIPTWEVLCFNKGQLQAIGKLLNFENTLAQVELEGDEGFDESTE